MRQPMTEAQARAEVARKLPFVAEIVVCQGRDVASLISKSPFEGHSLRGGVVRFVSVLSQRPRLTPSTPMRFPSTIAAIARVLRESQSPHAKRQNEMASNTHLMSFISLVSEKS